MTFECFTDVSTINNFIKKNYGKILVEQMAVHLINNAVHLHCQAIT